MPTPELSKLKRKLPKNITESGSKAEGSKALWGKKTRSVSMSLRIEGEMVVQLATIDIKKKKEARK